MDYSKLLEIGIPTISGIILVYLSFLFGKKSKRYESSLAKRQMYSEQIVSIFEEIHDLYLSLYETFVSIEIYKLKKNSISETEFSNLEIVSESILKVIDKLWLKKKELRELIRTAQIYFNKDIVNDINEYLNIGSFTIGSPELKEVKYYSFYRFHLDREAGLKRRFIYEDVIKKIRSMVN